MRRCKICIKVSLTILLLIYVGFFRIYIVNGHSMDPTLHNHQLVLVCKHCKIDNNDIVVAKSPDNKTVIKRIIATYPEEISTNGNRLIIDNIKTGIPTESNVNISNYEKDSYYLIGDNYLNSHDSRNYGWINDEEIIGKVIIY